MTIAVTRQTDAPAKLERKCLVDHLLSPVSKTVVYVYRDRQRLAGARDASISVEDLNTQDDE